jgi:hypothetical protein
MSAKIKYTNEPIGEIEIVPNFLPSPDELIFRDEETWAMSVTAEADSSNSSETA